MNSDSDSNVNPNPDNLNEAELEALKNRMNLELAGISANQLYNLASEAEGKKLISAHGHRGGQYELLREGEFILLSPVEAIQYLQDLLQETNS